MATKSILKTVDIKDKGLGRRFAEALDKARNTPDKQVEYKRNCREASNEEIRKMFK